MEVSLIVDMLVKNGPLVVMAAIFLKTYMDDTKIKREERKEDRALQKENNEKLTKISEKFAIETERTNKGLDCVSQRLEGHSSSSQSSLAEIKLGVNQIQKDVAILNEKIDDVAEDFKKCC